jgi:D-alanyl-lipoteichoic acid acyltransferase DltB (MBOAT superfamily)
LTGLGVLDGLPALAEAVLAGRAGLFTRVALACAAFVVASALLRGACRPFGRLWGQVAMSVVLLAWLTTPMLAGLTVGYALVLFVAVESLPSGVVQWAILVGLVALQVVAPIFFLPSLPGYDIGTRALVAFATNMTQLRAWAYAYDRLRRADPPQASLGDYALYTFFFPAFVSGPLVGPGEFLRRRQAWYFESGIRLEPATIVTALRRIALGCAAAGAVLYVAPVLDTTAYRAAATSGPLFAWGHSIGVYVAVYLGFSAWSEAAIGFALLAGVHLPENFDHAHLAYGAADFWRRWNIRLGRWMHDYIYVPLGGAHPGGRRDRVAWWNIAAVFLAVALYHHVGGLKLLGLGLGRFPMFYLGWTLWAVYNTLGTLGTRRLHRGDRWRPRDVAIVVTTFLFESMCLMTAFFPPTLGLGDLVAIYGQLLGLG